MTDITAVSYSDTYSDAMAKIGLNARAAARVLAASDMHRRNDALYAIAKALRVDDNVSAILAANQRDKERAAGLSPALIDRLHLDVTRIAALAESVDNIAMLPDPLGAVIDSWTVPNGLHIESVRVPIGVIGIIYESRPNVTVDAAALCIKSGNACILRPGSESFATARVLVDIITRALEDIILPAECVQMVPTPDRDLVGEMLRMNEHIDVIIPRGGKSLIARVMQDSRVPVLAHLDGNCHTYVDGDADLAKARAIVLNAKMRRTGICGATETLLIDKACEKTHLAPLINDLLAAGCAVRGDATVCASNHLVTAATELDWSQEYLDAIIAVKIVDGVQGAVEHIARYGSHHTDCIITENKNAAEIFLRNVDSAIVMHNTSTQFADGGEFGMGAEMGIATGRLHARGPVGVKQLTTFKYIVRGNGQIRK